MVLTALWPCVYTQPLSCTSRGKGFFVGDGTVAEKTERRDLMLIGRARKALAEAKTVSQVKAVRDMGQAAIHWARTRREIGLEAQNDAAEIVLEAERRLGVMLAEIQRADKRDNLRQGPKSHDVTSGPTLSDLGIRKSHSSRWQDAARVPEPDYRSWVTKARKSQRMLTSGELQRMGRDLRRAEDKAEHRMNGKKAQSADWIQDLGELVKRGEKFGCIYADPPWEYGNRGTRSNVAGEYQSTMTVEELCQEPVGELAADVCHLHLWVTVAFTFEAKRLLDAWGFTFRSEIVWCKTQMGIGNYWRLSHEKLLLATRGDTSDVVFPDGQKNHRSWLEARRGRHSAKPDAFRRLIEEISPAPRLELYGRHRTAGWLVYGNEITDDAWTRQ